MYTSVHIKNFRGMEDLRVEDIRRINLIVGRNNAGKTSLLEALLLIGWPTRPSLTLTLGTMRGQRRASERPDAIWRSLFHGMDPSRTIELATRDERSGFERILSIQAGPSDEATVLPEQDMLRTPPEGELIQSIRYRYRPPAGEVIETQLFIDPSSGQIRRRAAARDESTPSVLLAARSNVSLPMDIERYSGLLRAKQERWVLDALRIIEPKLEKLELVTEGGEPSIYADVGLPSLVPLAICGEGMVRMFSIVVELTASRGGALLIDEIDNGLHHSVMSPFWGALGQLAADLDVQIFATTHSDEIIRAAIQAFSGDLSALRIFRLDRRGEGLRLVRYGDVALEGVLDHDAEVRG